MNGPWGGFTKYWSLWISCFRIACAWVAVRPCRTQRIRPTSTHVLRRLSKVWQRCSPTRNRFPPSSSPVVKQPFVKTRYVVYGFFYVYTECNTFLFWRFFTFEYVWYSRYTMCIIRWWFFYIEIGHVQCFFRTVNVHSISATTLRF